MGDSCGAVVGGFGVEVGVGVGGAGGAVAVGLCVLKKECICALWGNNAFLTK